MSEWDCVLDASVLLAVIRQEPGAGIVCGRLKSSCISAINLSEVIAKLSDLGFSDEIIDQGLAEFDLDVRPFDSPQARSAGLLRIPTRALGLSFADRACLALAAELGRPAITADEAWATLDIGIAIELIR